MADEKENLDVTCHICGKDDRATFVSAVKERMLNELLCFNCLYWLEREVDDKDSPDAIVTADYRHYVIGPEDAKPRTGGGIGFGGSRFLVLFKDGRQVITTNLWGQEEIPEHMRDRFTPNAEIGRS